MDNLTHYFEDFHLFRHLLSFSDVDADSTDMGKAFSELPHLELLCSHLIDPARNCDEVSKMYVVIGQSQRIFRCRLGR
jgi:hypothetical protein